jgi:hypothetical protein
VSRTEDSSRAGEKNVDAVVTGMGVCAALHFWRDGTAYGTTAGNCDLVLLEIKVRGTISKVSQYQLLLAFLRGS